MTAFSHSDVQERAHVDSALAKRDEGKRFETSKEQRVVCDGRDEAAHSGRLSRLKKRVFHCIKLLNLSEIRLLRSANAPEMITIKGVTI